MQGEFDYDESVDVFLNIEGATPVAMRGGSLARAIQVVVDQWSTLGEGSLLINRDGSDIKSYAEVLAIYQRDDFPACYQAQQSTMNHSLSKAVSNGG